jgi:hypothetical protein
MGREVDLNTIRAETTKEPLRISFGPEDAKRHYEAPAELPYPAFRALGKLAGLDAADPAVMAPVLDTLDVVMVTLIGAEAWAREAPECSATDVLGLLQAVLVNYGFADAGGTPEAALGESQASTSP